MLTLYFVSKNSNPAFATHGHFFMNLRDAQREQAYEPDCDIYTLEVADPTIWKD